MRYFIFHNIKILLNMCIATVSKSPFITKVTKYHHQTYSITYIQVIYNATQVITQN